MAEGINLSGIGMSFVRSKSEQFGQDKRNPSVDGIPLIADLENKAAQKLVQHFMSPEDLLYDNDQVVTQRL